MRKGVGPGRLAEILNRERDVGLTPFQVDGAKLRDAPVAMHRGERRSAPKTRTKHRFTGRTLTSPNPSHVDSDVGVIAT